MGQLLWRPSTARVENSNMFRFMEHINHRYGLHCNDYGSLYEWSIDHIPEFWAAAWDFLEIKASQPYVGVIDDLSKMPGAQWFSGARLNFAENLLRYRDDRIAIVSRTEKGYTRHISYETLYGEVAALAKALREAGVTAGDRVAGFMPNLPETVIAMLATASIGAIWSSCSPDFGKKGVLDRFGQIKPKILFSTDGYLYKGKHIDSISTIKAVVEEIPSIQQLIIIPYVTEKPAITDIPKATLYHDFISTDKGLAIEFAQLPFQHPLYIMYSSGTTGLPKCMVQSAGGVLINQLKEHVLHTDVTRDDTVFYFTTCGWMMWNWLVCGLATGATLVLYEGNPFHPGPEALWQLAQDEKITVFGTSAGYLAALQHSGLKPGREFELSALRSILSTGSPLSDEGFEFVYRDIKQDLQLASISGGTDLNGCFALGNPFDPVYAGELQCRGLGMKVGAFDEQGQAIIGQQGELVCTAPFPSMPIYFWDDADGRKYHDAYFDVYPGIWRHGDYIEISERGSVVIHGRSDATLNPGGVRIGTADIYRYVEQIEEIEDSVVTGQHWKNDTRIILFVKLKPGITLTAELQARIRKTIRSNTSPRHVPAKIIAVGDIPYTLNMKKVEIAVRKTIHGEAIQNRDAIKNPEALDCYHDLPELAED